MKEKFEANVATEIPKTKLHEPALPWKLTEDEVGQIGPKDDDFGAVISGTPPLKTRALFLITLIVAIFGITVYLVVSASLENERMRRSISRKEGELSLVHANLVKSEAEKKAISENTTQLEKKVSDLAAQKQLFASVIESLTKKGEDIDMPAAAPILTMSAQDNKAAAVPAPQAPTPTPAANNAN